MCKKLIAILPFFPLFLYSTEQIIPAGSTGNQLILSVYNSGTEPLNTATVQVTAKPNWILFEEMVVILPEVAPRVQKEAVFTFQTTGGESGLAGTVILQVRDKMRQLLAEKQFQLKSALTEDVESLFNAYPNPANPNVTIPFLMRERGEVRLEIFNPLGQRIRILLNETRPAGRWQVNWDGRDEAGRLAACGVYVVRLETRVQGQLQQHSAKILLAR